MRQCLIVTYITKGLFIRIIMASVMGITLQ